MKCEKLKYYKYIWSKTTQTMNKNKPKKDRGHLHKQKPLNDCETEFVAIKKKMICSVSVHRCNS